MKHGLNGLIKVKLWVSLHVKKRQWQLQWHWNCMFHFPNFGIALALFQMLPSNKCHTRGRFKINWNKCKRYLSEEVLYMFAFIFCKYVVCRGVQFRPLYLMPPFWNSADPPVKKMMAPILQTLSQNPHYSTEIVVRDENRLT